MKVCKNAKKKNYSGNENTPLGRGYHASGEKIGTQMRGKNKAMYEVIKTQNGKRWKKINKSTKNKTKRGDSFWGGGNTLMKMPDSSDSPEDFDCSILDYDISSSEEEDIREAIKNGEDISHFNDYFQEILEFLESNSLCSHENLIKYARHFAWKFRTEDDIDIIKENIKIAAKKGKLL